MAGRIEIRSRRGIETMSFPRFVRWACLIEAMDVISQKCEEMKIERQDTSWIKPNAIEKYIDERESTMTMELERQLERPGLCNVGP
jgi:hypothetical protein